MSDEEISEDGDFSGSEDEWQPDGENPSSSEAETENEDENTLSISKVKGKTCARKSARPSLEGSRRKLSQTLRVKMFKRYKPLPKAINVKASQSIIERAPTLKSQSKEKQSSNQSDEDSDSSGDDYLVNPNDLDLNSSFFDITPNDLDEEKPPEFDCNAGLRLSDSEEDGENDLQEVENKIIIPKYLDAALDDKGVVNTSNLKHLHDYAMKLESDKEHLRGLNYERKKEQDIDVSQLLALGEKQETRAGGVAKKRRKAADTDSESDWEEVEVKNLLSKK